jgi:lysophospholipase L1-like esterase
MIEFQPHRGPQQEFSSSNRFVLRYGLCTIFLFFLIWDGHAAFASPKKPVKPAAQKAQAHHPKAAKKGSAPAKPSAHTKHSKGQPPLHAGTQSTAHGRKSHAAVPFKPRYSVARPVPVLPPVSEPNVPVPAGELDDSMLAEPSGGPFRYPHALDAFFNALSALPQGATAPQTADAPASPSTVRILQFGDSHTAADIFTGEMRAQFQAHFGNGGLGFQYPGHPFPGYRLAGSARSQTYGWVTQGNRFNELGDGDTGLGGIAISTTRPGESVTVSTTCETLQVEYLRQPGGGILDFSDNRLPVAEINTGADNATASSTDPAAQTVTRGAGTFTYSCTPGEHEFQLITVEEKPVRLLGLVTEQAGVTYECLGINGAVAPLILRWNQQMFGDYLGQRDPNLIVLAYGTNEATASASRNDEYVAQFHQLLQNLHRIVPNASILVLGPYDRAIKVGRGRHAAWRTTYAIDRIIADQREACRVDNCAFYDQRARMGGPGVMLHWVANGLAQGDHTHLTGTGYRVLADALYRDLLSVYNSYLQGPRNNGEAPKSNGEAPASGHTPANSGRLAPPSLTRLRPLVEPAS